MGSKVLAHVVSFNAHKKNAIRKHFHMLVYGVCIYYRYLLEEF